MTGLGFARLAVLLPLLLGVPLLGVPLLGVPAMAQAPATAKAAHAPARHRPASRPRAATHPRRPAPPAPAPFARLPAAAEGMPRVATQPRLPVAAAMLAPPPGIVAAAPRVLAPGIVPVPAGVLSLTPLLSDLIEAPAIPAPPPVLPPVVVPDFVPAAVPPPVPQAIAPQAIQESIPPMRAEPICVENADIATLQQALAAGTTSAAALVRAYLARIDAYDRAGPALNSVREVNPDALAIAEALDAAPHRPRRALEGIPILLKDNIATHDRQHTTAGSLALADAQARRDATVAAKLRRAGAVILGKANLTEFANMLAIGMPSGYSSLGGQVRNPYAPDLDGKGVPIVPPGGSSAGSGVAVAAGLAAATIGTETAGSLLSPASQNGVVTIKPTLGLVSAAGIIPIAHSQDVAGPMTRTVRDAALILGVLAGPDPLDPATAAAPAGIDYTKYLDKDALRGKRIGVPSDPSDPANDVYYRPLTPQAAAVMAHVITVLEAQGATVVRANLPTEGWIGGAGTGMAILNRNPESPEVNRPATRPIVFIYELKHDMNLYLRDWAAGTGIRTLSDIVAFNAAHAGTALRFGQDLFLAADATRGDLREPEYASARRMDLRAARDLGLDVFITENRLDAVLFPGHAGAGIAAAAGYPSVQVPAGFVAGVNGQATPEYPLGATFTGRAFSEPTLLGIAYAFEQATLARRMPPGVPGLESGCGG